MQERHVSNTYHLAVQANYCLLYKDDFTHVAKPNKNKTVPMNNGCKSKICMGSMGEEKS